MYGIDNGTIDANLIDVGGFYKVEQNLRSRKWLEIYVTVKCALYGIKSIPLDCISFHSNSAPIFRKIFSKCFYF